MGMTVIGFLHQWNHCGAYGTNAEVDGRVDWCIMAAGTSQGKHGCSGNESNVGLFGSRILIQMESRQRWCFDTTLVYLYLPYSGVITWYIYQPKGVICV